MMEKPRISTIRIIGVGSLWRGDDAVGLLAAHLLRERLGASIEVIDAEGDGLVLMDAMEGADSVIVIDAVQGEKQPGEIVRLDVSKESRWDAILPRSTHAWSLAGAIDLARALGRLPKSVVLYGIAIGSAECGAPLSESVRAGLQLAVERVTEEIERARCTKCI